MIDAFFVQYVVKETSYQNQIGDNQAVFTPYSKLTNNKVVVKGDNIGDKNIINLYYTFIRKKLDFSFFKENANNDQATMTKANSSRFF